MKKLVIETQGVQGKNKQTNTIGFVQIMCENDMLIVDNFQGAGPTYKQREEPVITLSKDGKDYFHGTFKELLFRIKGY